MSTPDFLAKLSRELASSEPGRVGNDTRTRRTGLSETGKGAGAPSALSSTMTRGYLYLSLAREGHADTSEYTAGGLPESRAVVGQVLDAKAQPCVRVKQHYFAI